MAISSTLFCGFKCDTVASKYTNLHFILDQTPIHHLQEIKLYVIGKKQFKGAKHSIKTKKW